MINENVMKMLTEIKKLADEDYDSFMKAFIIFETETDETDSDIHTCADAAFCRYLNVDNVNFLSDEILEVMSWG